MGKKLATTVVLWDAELSGPVVLLEGTVPSKEQAAQISNPKAWGDESDEEPDDGRPAAGAKKADWEDYADSLGVEYPEGATKQEIVDAIDAA